MVKQPTGTNPRRYPPCADCGFKDWPATEWSDQYTYPTDGRCKNCYQTKERRDAGQLTRAEYVLSRRQTNPTRLPTGMITAAMQGIAPQAIAERCARAAALLRTEEAAGLWRGLAWREAHPDQFTPEAVRAVFRDPAGLAVSVWADELATAAA